MYGGYLPPEIEWEGPPTVLTVDGSIAPHGRAEEGYHFTWKEENYIFKEAYQGGWLFESEKGERYLMDTETTKIRKL